MSIYCKPLLFFGTILLIIFGAFSPLDTTNYKVRTIIIDAGHGGKDPGCMGKISKEKDIALQISLKLGEMISKNMPDVKVLYTRDDDRFIELHDRAGFANKNHADLFISIHVNAGPSGFKGTETYFMGLHKSEDNLDVAIRENSTIMMEKEKEENYEGFDPKSPQSYILFSLFQNAYMHHSASLADKIEEQFKLVDNRHSRGVKQAGFLVLWKTSMPSVLVETGFLTDATDEIYLNNAPGKNSTATAIFNAVQRYKEETEE